MVLKKFISFGFSLPAPLSIAREALHGLSLARITFIDVMAETEPTFEFVKRWTMHKIFI